MKAIGRAQQRLEAFGGLGPGFPSTSSTACPPSAATSVLPPLLQQRARGLERSRAWGGSLQAPRSASPHCCRSDEQDEGRKINTMPVPGPHHCSRGTAAAAAHADRSCSAAAPEARVMKRACPFIKTSIARIWVACRFACGEGPQMGKVLHWPPTSYTHKAWKHAVPSVQCLRRAGVGHRSRAHFSGWSLLLSPLACTPDDVNRCA